MVKLRSFLNWTTLALAVVVAPVVAKAQINDKDFAAAMQRFLDSPDAGKSLGKFLEDFPRRKQMEQMQAKLDEQFKNPIKVDIGGSPVKGPANAKVTVIEWSDFQCPFCKRGKDVVSEILKAYPNDVKVVFKHLPLQFHPLAQPAAKATFAAQKQGKFWEMHDALFDNQDKLSEDFIASKAKELGLDMDKFKADSTSAEAEAAVKADMDAAAKLGIGGTPSFLVNGVEVRGAFPFDHFKMIIDRWLATK